MRKPYTCMIITGEDPKDPSHAKTFVDCAGMFHSEIMLAAMLWIDAAIHNADDRAREGARCMLIAHAAMPTTKVRERGIQTIFDMVMEDLNAEKKKD